MVYPHPIAHANRFRISRARRKRARALRRDLENNEKGRDPREIRGERENGKGLKKRMMKRKEKARSSLGLGSGLVIDSNLG